MTIKPSYDLITEQGFREVSELFINPMQCPECGERFERTEIYDLVPYERYFEVCERCWGARHD